MQEAQSLGCNLDIENIDPGRVFARSGEAGNKTELNRVFAYAENNWYRRTGGFGRKRCRLLPGVAITATRPSGLVRIKSGARRAAGFRLGNDCIGQIRSSGDVGSVSGLPE